jgi:hypothetical protein
MHGRRFRFMDAEAIPRSFRDRNVQPPRINANSEF